MKFKITVKRSDINDLQRRLNSGELSTIQFQGKEYILDTNKTKDYFEIRLYPRYFTYKGRNDGYCLFITLTGTDWERAMLKHYTEVLQQLSNSFEEMEIEIEEDIIPPLTQKEKLLKLFKKK